MNKDLLQNESECLHYSLVKQPSMTETSPIHTSIIEQYSNSLHSSLKKRGDDVVEGHEMKNFPSKVNVCKGFSSKNVIPFSANSNKSPVVQYYAGIIQSPDANKNGLNSPEVQDIKNERPFHSQVSHFNQTPQYNQNSSSIIFNKIISSNSSVAAESKNNSSQTPKQTTIQTPFMSKTLQEKIEENFSCIKEKYQNENDTIKVKSSDYQSKSNLEEEEDDESDSSSSNKKNRDLYMLSFNSDEEGNEEKAKEDSKHSQNHQHNQHQYHKEIKERSNKETLNKHVIKNKFDEANGNISYKNNLKLPFKENYQSLEGSNAHYQDSEIEYYQLPTTNNPQLSNYDKLNVPINENLSHASSYLEYQIMASQRNIRIRRIDPVSYVDQSYDILSKNLYLLSKDQGGCRYLQKILEQDSINVINSLYPSLIEFIVEVVIDPFGNYFIQKILNYLNENQLLEVMTKLSPRILDIGRNSHGTRVVQQLINYLSTQSLINNFVKIIIPFIIPLLNELNGTHIIQKFCFVYPNEAYDIYLVIIENCLSLATHRHGCCVLQKYLETFEKDLYQKLLAKLIANCLLLIIDQFGNYVIQSILYCKDTKSSNAIVDKLLENVFYYSKHKYSSNVVEKCFDYCDNNIRQKLINALAKKEIINDLILDEHGNYVVQKVLEWTDYHTQTQLLQGIIPLFPKIHELSYGEHIISRLVISYPQLSNKQNGKDGMSNNSKSYRGGAYSRKGFSYYYNSQVNNEEDNNCQNCSKKYNNGNSNSSNNKNYSGGFNNNTRHYKGKYKHK